MQNKEASKVHNPIKFKTLTKHQILNFNSKISNPTNNFNKFPYEMPTLALPKPIKIKAHIVNFTSNQVNQLT